MSKRCGIQMRAVIPRSRHRIQDEADVAHVERAEDSRQYVPELAPPAREIERAAEEWQQRVVGDVREMQILVDRPPGQYVPQRRARRRVKERHLDGLDRAVVVSSAQEAIEVRHLYVEKGQDEHEPPVAHRDDPSALREPRQDEQDDDDPDRVRQYRWPDLRWMAEDGAQCARDGEIPCRQDFMRVWPVPARPVARSTV